MTYLGLCYHPTGIMFWKYDGSSADGASKGCYIVGQGVTSIGETVIDDLNPYIKAIDYTYLGLTWDNAYHIRPDSAMPACWIDTIYAVSNSSDSNPDLGWFHIGQFTEGSARHVMLVNRACSQGENDPTPAPSVTATVKFDPSDLGLGNYVYIIDIATGTDADDWVGTPDTTYSAALNGTIPFTTVLGPGEGRLFKIVGTSALDQHGDVHHDSKARIKEN